MPQQPDDRAPRIRPVRTVNHVRPDYGGNVDVTGYDDSDLTERVTDLEARTAGHIIRDEGSDLPQRPWLDFVGPGVTAEDHDGVTRVTIPGAGFPPTGGFDRKIDQFTVAGTTVSAFSLTYYAIQDSWNVTLNGVGLLDDAADPGITGDYTIDGFTLTILDPTALFAGAATQGSPWTLQVQYDRLPGLQVPVVASNMPTDMIVWLKGSEWDADGVTADGTAENTWHDQSGNNNHAAVPALGNGGLYYSNQTPTGGGIVRFGGPNGSIRYDLPSGLMAGVTAGEVFVVLKSVTDTADNPGLWFIGSDAVNFTNYPNSASGGIIGDSFGSTVGKATPNPTVDLSTWHVYNALSKAGEWTARINGTLLYTTATNTVGWRTIPTLGYIPTGGAPSTYVWDGDMAEFILYDRELTADERAGVVAYLTARHGL